MIQVLCSHRHGSDLYCRYTKREYDLKFVNVYDSGVGYFGERSSFFSMEYKINGSNDILHKLDYLKYKKTQGLHYFMKIMPQKFYESHSYNILNNLLEYIND